jgi:signal transduction histidine kinase
VYVVAVRPANQVAHGDDANHLAILQHRQMAATALDHQRRRFLGRGVDQDEREVPRHDGRNARDGWIAALEEHAPHDVPLGDDFLRLSEERFRLAADAGELGIWEYVIATGKFAVDERLLAMYELEPDAAPSYETFIARIYPSDRLTVQDQVQRAIVVGGEIHVEYRTTTSRGMMWVESHGRALLDDGGEPQRLIGTTRDSTERHRYDEVRELLPGLLAHDLRTPLSAIKMAGQQLQKEGAEGGRASPTADVIRRSADHMARMVERLLHSFCSSNKARSHGTA